MPRFISTTGQTKIAIGICGRCSRKFPYSELKSDPNSPGLFVCDDDLDVLDPYRLPARETESITLEHPRPDVVVGIGPQVLEPPLQFDGLTQLQPSQPWAASTFYTKGSQVTPINPIGFDGVGRGDIYVYAAITPGISGAVRPSFPIAAGATVHDGAVVWANVGLFLP